eukprot:sb/3474312/
MKYQVIRIRFRKQRLSNMKFRYQKSKLLPDTRSLNYYLLPTSYWIETTDATKQHGQQELPLRLRNTGIDDPTSRTFTVRLRLCQRPPSPGCNSLPSQTFQVRHNPESPLLLSSGEGGGCAGGTIRDCLYVDAIYGHSYF